MNELPNRDNLLPQEIVKFTRLSRSKVYELLELGEIPSIKVSGLYRIPREKFLEWWRKQPSNENFLSA